MPDCSDVCRIDAYHDGELDPAARAAVEEHLLECPQCREELAALQRLSRRFATAPAVGLTRNKLHDLYKANQAPAERSLLPFAIGLLATAASILVVCAAWLSEIAPVGPSSTVVAAKEIPDWERYAMSGQVEAMPGPEGSTAVAQADLAAWILLDLSMERQP